MELSRILNLVKNNINISNLQTFRLSLATGVPVMKNDVASATSIYLTPFDGNFVALVQDGDYRIFESAEIGIGLTNVQSATLINGNSQITLVDTSQLIIGMEITGSGVPGSATISTIDSLTQLTMSGPATADGSYSLTFKVPADKNLDLFCFVHSNSPKLEFGPLWSGDNTRATGLTRDSRGILTKTGFGTRRYLGTIRTSSTAGETGWDSYRRFVWNYYNQIPLFVKTENSNASWSYTTASWREYNNGSGQSRGQVVVGWEFLPVTTQVSQCRIYVSISATGYSAVPLNSPTPGTDYPYISNYNSYETGRSEQISLFPSLGYNYITQSEYGTTGMTTYGSGCSAQMLYQG